MVTLNASRIVQCACYLSGSLRRAILSIDHGKLGCTEIVTHRGDIIGKEWLRVCEYRVSWHGHLYMYTYVDGPRVEGLR